jgi:hypothetical protein
LDPGDLVALSYFHHFELFADAKIVNKGYVLSDSEILHVFTVNSGLIAAMYLGDEADPTAGPSAAFVHRS